MGEPALRRPPVVGMVGAGQLARMTVPAAVALNCDFRVLAETSSDSAAQVCAGTTVGDFGSVSDLLAFAVGCDVITFDHEHVPNAHLSALERITAVRPGRGALRFAQNKRAMREKIVALGIRCPGYQPVSALADVRDFAGRHGGWPVVLKAIAGGYDGKGVWVCDGPEDAAKVLGHGIGVIAEEHLKFDSELAVLIARSPRGQGAAYPVVRTVQRDGVCREVIAPAPGLDPGLAICAQRLGLEVAAELGVTGLLAVELFLAGGELIVNELAMRPHNSGHWTIDAAVTSQFEQHLRAILDLPLGSTAMTARHAVMVNLLGGDEHDLHAGLPHVMAADPGVKVHLYGKPVRRGRKVGHVTVAGDEDLETMRDRAWRAAEHLSPCAG